MVVLPEASTCCSGVSLWLHFLKLNPSSTLGRFSAEDSTAVAEVDTPIVGEAADLLPAPPPNFILPRLNISTQQGRSYIPVFQIRMEKMKEVKRPPL
ncbi:hypothetical protein BHE74_00041275 [Ensete ventricosum]|nr:hypothetical protein BHE74_00041275 [Ensete ventricosum]